MLMYILVAVHVFGNVINCCVYQL